MIVYLPPTGPKVCAYTAYNEISSVSWSESKTYPDLVTSYSNPFEQQWTESNIIQSLDPPDCPCYNCNCDQSIDQYDVREDLDPDDAVTVTFDEPSLTVTGTSESSDFSDNVTESIDLSDFINAPNITSNETTSLEILVKLVEGVSTLRQIEGEFFTCSDNDEDGFCAEFSDCNDTDPNSNPDGIEICDGNDNDCDGNVDENFFGSQFECILNKPCNNWNGSVCSGICSCSENGTNVSCAASILPGEQPEVCLNGLDDDCDGEVDEIWDIIEENGTEGCVWSCVEGAEKPCYKNIGYCLPGVRTCENGSWSECDRYRKPREEVCNMALNQLPRYADDDCDGTIDNVFGGTSIEETKCQCYDGRKPIPEICNGIDDDCDREIDEKSCRCSEGETKPCGNDQGICKPGIQYCVEGYWATNCTGGTRPSPEGEICYNNLDDNCNGKVDELCNTGFTCNNDIWDLNEEGVDCGGDCSFPCAYPVPWIIFAIAIIGFIAAFIILEMKGKIPA
jgi:hypothetical protein